MPVKAVKIVIEKLNLTFESGDQKLENLVINGGARERTSNAQFSVIDNDLTISDKVFSWSRENGGIKIPQELRGSKTVQSTSTTGGNTPNPGGSTTNGAKLEGLENEIVEVSSYMDVISWCEGTYPDGYNIMFTGATFSDFSDHPRQIQGGGGLSSDAAGRYQFLSTTWDSVAGSLGLTDFSPKSQNIAGWQLAKNRGVTPDDIVADPVAALKKAAQEWASLPGSPYGQPTKTEEECRSKFEEFNNARKAQEGTTTDTSENLTEPDQMEEFSYYYADTVTPSNRAFLDLIAESQGTYDLGDEGYFNDPQGSELLESLDEYPGYKSGRYNIDQESFDDSEKEDFSARSQDDIAIQILQNLDGNPYAKLNGGDLEGAILDAGNYWSELNNTRSTEEWVEFYNERLEYWNENSPNVDGGITPDNDGENTSGDIGGTKVIITVVTDQSVYSYQYILVNVTVDGFPVPKINFDVQGIKYALGVNKSEESFEDINSLELAQITAYRYNIPFINRFNPNKNIIAQNQYFIDGRYVPARNESSIPVENPGVIPNSPNRVPGNINQGRELPNNSNDNPINLENKERVDGEGRTDLEVLNDETEEEPIAVTEDTNTGSIVVTAERLSKAKRIIIEEITDIRFEDRGVVDEDPLYPVNIESVLNDSLLELKPEDDVTLNNAYSLIPNSLKNDVWIVMGISHNILQNSSTLELLKYIPIEEEETTGTTATGGGILTLDQIHAKWDNSIVKVGDNVASGGYATGWVVSEDGYILSAAHMAGMTEIEFKDGTTDNATQVDIDQGSDLMLLKIEKSGLTPISIAPDTSIYDDGSNMTIHSIGHPGNTSGGHDDWRGATSKVIRIEENGYSGLSGKTLIIDDTSVDFAFHGNSGGPFFDAWGLGVSITSGGQGSKPDNSDGQEVWGTAVENIITFLTKNNVNFVTGSRAAATPSTGGGGIVVNNRPSGVYPGFVSPSDGALTSGFGPRTAPTAGASSNHKGLDLAAGCGSPIYAAHSGEVMNASDTGSGHGIYVAIKYDTDPDIWTMYGHCESVSVAVGDIVQAGQEIAKEGTTGVSTGCHLHFEVRTGMTGKTNVYEGTAVDPAGYIPVGDSYYDLTSLRNRYGKTYNLGLLNDRVGQGIGFCVTGQQLDDF